VKPTERVDGSRHQLVDRRGLRDVRVHEQPVAAALVHPRDRLLATSTIDVGDHHRRAALSERQRSRSSDTRRATGHERHVAALSTHARPPLFAPPYTGRGVRHAGLASHTLAATVHRPRADTRRCHRTGSRCRDGHVALALHRVVSLRVPPRGSSS
jgi:hypothetical protein